MVKKLVDLSAQQRQTALHDHARGHVHQSVGNPTTGFGLKVGIHGDLLRLGQLNQRLGIRLDHLELGRHDQVSGGRRQAQARPG